MLTFPLGNEKKPPGINTYDSVAILWWHKMAVSGYYISDFFWTILLVIDASQKISPLICKGKLLRRLKYADGPKWMTILFWI